MGEAAGKPGDVLPLPRLKKNYDGRAFRLLELTLHNVMEQRMANANLQKQVDAHMAESKKLLADNRYSEAEQRGGGGCLLVPG